MIRTLFEQHSTFEGQTFHCYETLETATDLHPHILVLNKNMLGNGCLRIYTKVKKRFPKAHIIFVSDNNEKEIDLRSMGISAYILKDERFRINLINTLFRLKIEIWAVIFEKMLGRLSRK